MRRSDGSWQYLREDCQLLFIPVSRANVIEVRHIWLGLILNIILDHKQFRFVLCVRLLGAGGGSVGDALVCQEKAGCNLA